MKVILQDHVQNLGDVGDVVDVKDGYGRNFLIPRGLALLADERNVRRLEHQKRVTAARKAKLLSAAKELAERIGTTHVSIKRAAGDEDKLHGSVTSIDIAKALADEGIEVDKRAIQLADPIKSIGAFTVPVKVHGDVEASVKVYVLREA